MEFRYEIELFEPVESWLAHQGLQTRREFVLPWGVCDMVGVSFDDAKIEKRLGLKQRQKIGPLSRIELLLSLPDTESDQSISLAALERKYKNSFPKEILLQELQVLKSRKFVRTDGQGKFQKLNGWIPMHRRLVAVELKLTRVREALQQAINHRSFADESYVALPERVARSVTDSAARMNQFKEYGVGLLGVTTTECRVVLPVQPKVPDSSPFQIHAAERLWHTQL